MTNLLNWEDFSEDTPYFEEHDGDDIGFRLQEGRLLSVLACFRPRHLPQTMAIFEHLSRLGPRTFTYGVDFHLPGDLPSCSILSGLAPALQS